MFSFVRTSLAQTRLSAGIGIAFLVFPLAASADITFSVLFSDGGITTGTVTYAAVGDPEPTAFSFQLAGAIVDETDRIVSPFETTWTAGVPTRFGIEGRPTEIEAYSAGITVYLYLKSDNTFRHGMCLIPLGCFEVSTGSYSIAAFGVGTEVIGQIGTFAICKNNTTGDSVRAVAFGTKLDCSAAGLASSSGDYISILTIGIVD